MPPTPSDEDKEELLLSCRYGELEEVKSFVETFSADPIPDIVDENGNTVLHMICANGHLEILEYLLPLLPSSLLTRPNSSLSTPLHWACLNSHLSIVQKLVQDPRIDGSAMIDLKNRAGRTPLGEAEAEGWDEGARWLVSMMKLQEGKMMASEDEAPGKDVEGKKEASAEVLGGEIAKMTIGESSTTDSAEDMGDNGTASLP